MAVSYRHIRPGEIQKRKSWWRWGGSNPQPQRCERCALPIELHPHSVFWRRRLQVRVWADRRKSRPYKRRNCQTTAAAKRVSTRPPHASWLAGFEGPRSSLSLQWTGYT